MHFWPAKLAGKRDSIVRLSSISPPDELGGQLFAPPLQFSHSAPPESIDWPAGLAPSAVIYFPLRPHANCPPTHIIELRTLISPLIGPPVSQTLSNAARRRPKCTKSRGANWPRAAGGVRSGARSGLAARAAVCAANGIFGPRVALARAHAARRARPAALICKRASAFVAGGIYRFAFCQFACSRCLAGPQSSSPSSHHQSPPTRAGHRRRRAAKCEGPAGANGPRLNGGAQLSPAGPRRSCAEGHYRCNMQRARPPASPVWPSKSRSQCLVSF